MACCAPWWTVVCVSVVEDVWEKRWEKVVGVKRSCNTAVYLEGTGGREECLYWKTDGLARVSVSEVERGEEEGKKTTRQLYLCLLGHWAHGSATDKSIYGLGGRWMISRCTSQHLRIARSIKMWSPFSAPSTKSTRYPGARALFEFTETMR